MEDAYKFEHVN